MNVHNRLAGVRSDVDSDVVTGRVVTLVQSSLGAAKNRHDGRDLIPVQIKKGFHMSPGHCKRVSGRNGKSVFDREG